MTIDYTIKGEVKIDMTKYVEDMLRDFPIKFKETQVATTKKKKKSLLEEWEN